MNKKLIIGISAGVAVLLAVVIAIFAITGNLNFKKPDNPSSNNNSAASDIAPSTEDENGNKDFVIEPEKLQKESIISVPIIIKNNPGFYAGEFLLTFDNAALSYVDYSEGAIVNQYDVQSDSDKIKILSYNSAYEDVKKDGTLMVLNFKVLKESADGKYTITIQKDGTMLGSFVTGEEVKADILLGKATVK